MCAYKAQETLQPIGAVDHISACIGCWASGESCPFPAHCRGSTSSYKPPTYILEALAPQQQLQGQPNISTAAQPDWILMQHKQHTSASSSD
jgi:hypothetical protein